MQQININELKPHPRNNEFFDDITGSNWDQFIDSMRERIKKGKTGNVEPIVITQDKVIVSGHQRVRALKELGVTHVNAEIKIYESEDEILADLIETNIRQRGIGNPNAMKLSRCIKEIERIYGVRNGSSNKKGNNRIGEPKVSADQSDVANMFGLSVDTIQNYKKLSDLIPELQDWVETGILAPTTAIALIKYMSPSEQEDFVKSMDITQKITKREVQQYIDKIKQLESNNPKVKQLENQISDLKAEKSLLEKKVKLNQEESDKYNKLKTEIEFLTKQKSDLGRQIDSATELAGLTVRLQKLLEDDLAPIKFKRCMESLDSSDVCVSNLEEIITKLDNWSYEMKKLLTNKYDDVVEA